MMEGMNQSVQEEYIWAMRSGAYRESDSDLWRDRRATPLSQGTTTTSTRRKNRSNKSIIPMSDDHHTKVLASLVPDEIIYNVNDYSIRPYDACFLFGDVSGFTDLSEKYNKSGKGGPSRLTQILNIYIGSMVQEVMSHGGDVLKFSGDAFLAMWKSSSDDSMPDCVHEALDCALMIQKSYGIYETDVGVMLRVKLAISAGHVVFSLIGDEKMSHYVVVGQPIWDVKAAEHISSAGEIIVSPNAWHYVNPNEYIYEQMSDKLHIKVQGLGPNWRNTQRSIKYQKNDFVDDQMDDFQSKYDTDNEDSLTITTLGDVDSKNITNDEFLLRPAVNDAAKMGLKEDLRKFIIPPVMRGIDLDEPLEYLTEMRQIVILFINVITLKIDLTEFVKLVDTAYKIVCSVVDDMQGCVNKVSLFDKDLMFVVIFGLRGFKHELESQIGLRCASECYQAITNINGVKTTSISVTTGMTYCGIVGHTLRREYTVISIQVNKAARLMVAYPNKVTCDRETFLHSKMEARNFILQEHKELKGITNCGPVYEFKEVSAIQGIPHGVNPFPLLGRNGEVKLYSRLLDECIDLSRQVDRNRPGFTNFIHHNSLLIRGDARQGKTRLLNEYIYCTPHKIPVNRISLTNRDSKIPYQTIQLIFSMPLGITDTSTSKDREEKIISPLRKIKVPDLLCVLNHVFSTNFEKSALYLSLSQEEKGTVLEKMIKQLSYGCFPILWVIIIDDGEFIDDESWRLIKVLIHADVVFFTITMGTRKVLTPVAAEIVQDKRIRTISLHSIDKWYHAGLACQILDVHAIPPELEKVIQSRSNGNPGWVESFLVSLIQAGGLFIRNVDRNDVHELGLVSPPIDMMVRLTKEEKMLLEVAGKMKDVDSLDEEYKGDGWQMYQHSYKDSYMNLLVEEKFQQKLLPGSNVVPVCTIAPNFCIEDVDPELSLDVMMLKTFDSLTSYEQLLLKCSATLGEFFPREMLLYIFVSSSPRNTALAIQKLFEIRVLGCAKGDFTQGGIGMVFGQRLNNPNQDQKIKCECRGLKINENCSDLPKYASCGYLRFRLPMFRDTTYNLLTDNQKKEFHNKAVRFLEKETRRCRSCGNGFFVRILGTRNDEGFKRNRINRRISSIIPSFSREDLNIARISSGMSQFSDGSSPKFSRRATRRTLSSADSRSNFYRPHTPPEFMFPSCFGYATVRKLKRRNSLTKTFSAADFTNCQCPLILNTMYSQMLDHCKGAGRLDKMLDAMLEFSYVCIISCNIPQAMKILEDARTFIDSKEKQDAEEDMEWKIPLLRGKISTLVGYSRLELGQMEEAYQSFNEAMIWYGYPFPKSKTTIKLKTFTKEFKQRVGLFIFPNLLAATVNGYEAEFCDNLSECLSLMCRLFMDLDLWENAELAAVWSLNKALESHMDFYRLCYAYSNMMEVMHHQGKQNTCIALEVHALMLCHRKTSSIEAQELKAVGKLYAAIFCSRLLRSEIERAINIGFIMIRISSTIHAVQLILQTIPLLVQALLLRRRITEGVSLMHELEYYSEEDSDNSGRTWYYSLCVGLQLETGYTLVPFRRCEKFFQVEGETMITIRDPDAERRYYTVMWLWCIRNEEWEAATVWFTKAKDFSVIQGDDSLANIFTALYLLEGLILYLVGKMDKRNVGAVAHAYDEITTLIKALEKATDIVKIAQPRFYHLKAYFRFVKNNDNKSFSILSTAKSLAEKYDNPLELAWVEHSEKAWNNNLSSVLADFWKEHCESDNLMDYHEIDMNGGKLGLFTLPVPLYC